VMSLSFKTSQLVISTTDIYYYNIYLNWFI
jgi:hypothetical protein